MFFIGNRLINKKIDRDSHQLYRDQSEQDYSCILDNLIRTIAIFYIIPLQLRYISLSLDYFGEFNALPNPKGKLEENPVLDYSHVEI